MLFPKGGEMALIHKPCIHPQMKAKCCHDLLYKRSFHSSSQRANRGELNHHITHGSVDLGVPATGKTVKAAPCARTSGFHFHSMFGACVRGPGNPKTAIRSRHLVGRVSHVEHILMKRGHTEKLTFKHSTELWNSKFRQK